MQHSPVDIQRRRLLLRPRTVFDAPPEGEKDRLTRAAMGFGGLHRPERPAPGVERAFKWRPRVGTVRPTSKLLV